MRAAIIMSALLGAALAVPVPEELRKEFDADGKHIVELIDVVVDTITVTAGQAAPTPPPAPPAPAAINKHESHPKQPPPPPPPAYTPPAPSPVASTPAASTPSSQPSYGSGNDGSPMSGDKTILQVVNAWRNKYGLQPVTWDADMASSAQTQAQYNVNNNVGYADIHKTGKIYNAQVETPGMNVDHPDGPGHDKFGMTPFEFAYVWGWLCEVPSDPELKNSDGSSLCAKLQTGFSGATMTYTDDKNKPITGHHEALCDPSYKSIGCGFGAKAGGEDPWPGQWICNYSL